MYNLPLFLPYILYQDVAFKIIIVILQMSKIAHRVRSIYLQSQLLYGKLVNKDLFEEHSALSGNSVFKIRDSHMFLNGTNTKELS